MSIIKQSGRLSFMRWIVAGCLMASAMPLAAREPAAAERGDERQFLSVVGTTEPMETVRLTGQVSGTIAKVMVGESEKVQAGAMLAEIDNPAMRIELDHAAAKLERARALLLLRQSEQNYAARAVERARRDFETGSLSAQALDEIQSRRETAEAKLRIAQAEIHMCESDVMRAKSRLEGLSVRAPFSGVILECHASAGQSVVAGKDEALFVIASDLNVMKLCVQIPADSISRVHTGALVHFTVGGDHPRHYQGVIDHMRFDAQAAQRTGAYPVVIRFANSDLSVVPYLSVNTEIELGREKPAK